MTNNVGKADMVKLLDKIDNMSPDYVNTVSEEIFQKQPFFLTVLLGYRFDVSPEELDEIMKMYFLVWEYFRKNPKVGLKKITERDFEAAQRRHIQMLKYSQGESARSREQLYSDNWDNVQGKALVAMIILRIHERPVLASMDEDKRGIVLIGIKSFIECFEAL